MRPATAFILSAIDVGVLAEFPAELEPCVEEVLYTTTLYAEVSELIGNAHETRFVISDLRELDVNTRERIAAAIQRTTIPEAKRLSLPTPIPGVVTPKPETKLPPVPIPLPTDVLKLPDVMLPGTNTIEFQALIPGIKPPKIPLLIPGMEHLPLLPGWVIRNPSGDVIGEGPRLPSMITGYMSLPIPPPLPVPESLGRESDMMMHVDDFLVVEGDTDQLAIDDTDEEIEL